MKIKLLYLALTLSIPSLATEYQSLSEANYSKSEYGSYLESDSLTLRTKYYFDSKRTLGPNDQFSYINKTNNIFGLASSSDTDNSISSDHFDAKTYTFGGDYFVDKFLIGGSYTKVYTETSTSDNDFTVSQLNLGYFINKNLLISTKATHNEGQDNYYEFSVKYNQQINATDYLGYTFTSNDDFDTKTMAIKYFTHLGNNNYFVLDAKYTDFIDDTSWNVKANYYFNRNTSTYLSYGKDKQYAVGLSHFINNNIGIKASYGASSNDSDLELFSVSLLAQF